MIESGYGHSGSGRFLNSLLGLANWCQNKGYHFTIELALRKDTSANKSGYISRGRNMRLTNIIWMVLRWLLGLYFIGSTILVFVMFGGDQPSGGAQRAAEFTTALNHAGFVNPILSAVFLVGGLMLFFDRFAPTGLLLLAPATVVIACFHWFLTHSFIWGSIWPIWLALLLWHYRDVYARLWAKNPPHQEKVGKPDA